ncbi:hypothetical protein FRB91_000440 [Serendipita sp. 411]|nr:hypothetical protein FRB91_000440 [Serendipita sp. 411]
MMEPTSELSVVFGAMTFGDKDSESARTHSVEDIKEILDVFQKHGHTKVDTARVYTNGTSERLLGDIGWQQRGLVVHTKLYPQPNARHTPEDLRKTLQASLTALRTDKLELFYLHAPDRTIPWEVTFKAVDELHKEGKFDRLGISNYMSWEVAEIMTLCRINGWISPTVYQGSRFDDTKGTSQSVAYRKRYWNDHNFEALSIIAEAAAKENLTVAEVALRWMSHHSLMKREFGDAVIIGASKSAHLEQNLIDLEKGPLPDTIQSAVDAAWRVVAPYVQKYWH